jgi:hypothetical protein
MLLLIMGNSINPASRKRLPHLDEHVRKSVDLANGIPDETSGFYATLVITGVPDRETAKERVRMLHRSAQHIGVSMHAAVQPADDGTFNVEFTAINKAHARAYVVRKYGNDASKWPYRGGKQSA